MPIKGHPISAYTLNHKDHNELWGDYLTWDYVCRACMNKGKTVRMDVWKDENGEVWIQCPECKTKENISADMNAVNVV